MFKISIINIAQWSCSLWKKIFVVSFNEDVEHFQLKAHHIYWISSNALIKFFNFFLRCHLLLFWLWCYVVFIFSTFGLVVSCSCLTVDLILYILLHWINFSLCLKFDSYIWYFTLFSIRWVYLSLMLKLF